MAPRGTWPIGVVALLDLAQRVLGAPQVRGRVELLGLGEQFFLLLLVGQLLAVADLVRIRAGGEEDVLGGAELLPQVVVTVTPGPWHRLPAVHERAHRRAGRTPVGGGRQLLRLGDQLLLRRARLAPLGVERGEVRAAAATERVAGRGEPRPQRLVGLAVDARGWSSTPRRSPSAGRPRPSRRSTRRRSARPRRRAPPCGPPGRPGRRPSRRGTRRRRSRRCRPSRGPRAARPSRSPTAAAVGMDSARPCALLLSSAGLPVCALSRASSSDTSVARSSKRRP